MWERCTASIEPRGRSRVFFGIASPNGRPNADSGVGAADDIRRAAEEAHGLGLFVRSLVGLDRQAAKEALAGFLNGKMLSANQIEFVNLIVDHLTEHGVMAAAMLYESPFTDLTPRGPEELFTSAQVDELLAAIEQVRQSAIAA